MAANISKLLAQIFLTVIAILLIVLTFFDVKAGT